MSGYYTLMKDYILPQDECFVCGKHADECIPLAKRLGVGWCEECEKEAAEAFEEVANV